MTGIVKRFGDVVANDSADLELAAGEIHALVGENGAGKSTLMSVLYGLIAPDSGEIRVEGRPVTFRSPVDAVAAGMGMVHQAFRLFPSMTVAENVVYRAETRGTAGLLDRRAAVRAVQELSERYGLRVDPRARVRNLSVGVLQRVEILKALHREAQVLILDEPTAVLTPQETRLLFDVLRGLREAGRTVVIVTHKLGEVLELSDKVTVLRDGRTVARLVTAETDGAEIARHMTGRAVDLEGHYVAGAPGRPALHVEGLTVGPPTGRPVVDGVSLSVRAGEIVGIAGVAGNGQVELLEAIAGLRAARSGSVRIGDHRLDGLSAGRRREAGVAYVPEDRAATGSAVAASVTDNLAIGFHRRPPLRRGWRLDGGAMRSHARQIIEHFDIKVSSPSVPAGTLSGGNLQKLVVGREMAHDAPVLLVDQPTRGVDIGAIENIHARLRGYRDAGHAVLLASAELGELMALADRLLVMFGGRVVADLARGEATEENVGLAMAGLAATATARDTAS
ncbi:ABC transporter ATP-binding protein [Blastococcus deserti]|uniref:ABC transporter ATP-binding protein n=1 Tax=Blastococcus deserti TaxID=2259033 RepID=A0ABW4X9Q9_9ACTN